MRTEAEKTVLLNKMKLFLRDHFEKLDMPISKFATFEIAENALGTGKDCVSIIIIENFADGQDGRRMAVFENGEVSIYGPDPKTGQPGLLITQDIEGLPY
jgi:hypothetical protein